MVESAPSREFYYCTTLVVEFVVFQKNNCRTTNVIPRQFGLSSPDCFGIRGNDPYPKCLDLEHIPQALKNPNSKIMAITMHEYC